MQIKNSAFPFYALLEKFTFESDPPFAGQWANAMNFDSNWTLWANLNFYSKVLLAGIK